MPLDSDDMLAPRFCERMAEVLDSRPEIDVLSCAARIFRDGDGDGDDYDLAGSFLRKRFGLEHRVTLADMIGEHYTIPYFATFRRAAWEAAGWYTAGTDLAEDIALYLRLGPRYPGPARIPHQVSAAGRFRVARPQQYRGLRSGLRPGLHRGRHGVR